MPPASASRGRAPHRRPPEPPHSAPSPPPVEVVQVDGEGEHEERLGGLLEGALGEVGGGQVGDGDHGRGQQPPHRAEAGERRQRGQAGEHADRKDLADEGLAEANPRHRRAATASPCGPSG